MAYLKVSEVVYWVYCCTAGLVGGAWYRGRTVELPLFFAFWYFLISCSGSTVLPAYFATSDLQLVL